MIAVGYCRFSSDMQRDGYSIEAQKLAILKYAKDNNILINKFYIDEAISGTTDERPAFQEMIKDASLNKFNLVIVHKLDRFSRNKYDSAFYKKKLKDAKVKLVSVLEKLDDTPESIILESLLEGMAEYYSANLSREVIKGQRVAASKGFNYCGKVPQGYKTENKKLIIDPEKAPIIKNIFIMRANGTTVKEIYKYARCNGLNFKGFSTVNDIIKNKIYLGDRLYSKNTERETEYKNIVEPIVDTELFERANKAIEFRGRNRKNINILSGLLYCAKCGKRLNAVNNKKYSFYSCSGKIGHYNSNGNIVHECDLKSLNKQKIETGVLENIKSLFTTDEIIKSVQNMLPAKNEQSQEKINISKELKKVENKINNLIELKINNLIETEKYKTIYNNLQELKENMQIRLNNLSIDIDEINTDEIKEAYNILFSSNLSKEDKKELVRLIVERIDIGEDSYKIKYKFSGIINSCSLRTTNQ